MDWVLEKNTTVKYKFGEIGATQEHPHTVTMLNFLKKLIKYYIVRKLCYNICEKLLILHKIFCNLFTTKKQYEKLLWTDY